jgi:hypothetical protein
MVRSQHRNLTEMQPLVPHHEAQRDVTRFTLLQCRNTPENSTVDTAFTQREECMADQPRDLDSDSRTRGGPDREPTVGMPRWVKVFGVIAIVVVLVGVILHLAGGGLGGHHMSP